MATYEAYFLNRGSKELEGKLEDYVPAVQSAFSGVGIPISKADARDTIIRFLETNGVTYMERGDAGVLTFESNSPADAKDKVQHIGNIVRLIRHPNPKGLMLQVREVA